MPPRLSPSQFRLILPFVAFGIFLLLVPFPSSSTSTTHQFVIDARQYQYTPERIEVDQGDRLEITFTSSDVVHGFYLDGYGLDRRAVPGVAQSFSFTADQAGKFHYRCSVSCGPLHPFMTGELVVHANAPFWRAIGIALTAFVGAMFYIWQKTGGSNDSIKTYPTQ